MHTVLEYTEHRPYEIPSTMWTWQQVWENILFLHFHVPKEIIEPQIPSQLDIDCFEGKAWIGLIPFYMREIARRPFPPVPGLKEFPEFNVRTYVRHGNRRGIWFFSLDITNRLAAWAARTLFHLPYRTASMQCPRDEKGWVHYLSHEPHSGQCFQARYRPSSGPLPADPLSFIHWASERYCLFTSDNKNHLFRGDIHHPPWTFYRAEVEGLNENILQKFGAIGMHPDTVFCPKLDVVVWPLQKLC